MAGNDNNQAKVPTGVADIRNAVETANKAEDESLNKDDAAAAKDDDAADDDNSGDNAGDDSVADADSNDSDAKKGDDDDDGDDDNKDDSKPDAKKDPKSRRFTQFAGDGSEEAYLSNLEKGYDNSSKEAIRLNTELGQATNRIDAIMRVVQADPDLAAKLNAALKTGADAGGSDTGAKSDAAATDNPFVRNLQTEWQEKSEQEIEAFVEANPEVETDPKIKEDVKHWMSVFSNDQFNRTGKLMSGGEAMTAAYKHLNLENKLEKQNLADGAKKTATPTRSQGKAKKPTGEKPTFTSEQIAMAQAMGKDQAWLEKNAK